MFRTIASLLLPAVASAAIPLLFEPAATQPDTFIAYSERYSARLKADGFQVRGRTGSFWLRFSGSTGGNGCYGEAPGRGKTNYLLGPDARKWKPSVPQFGRVRCPKVYPGIDVVYYSTPEGLLEFDFNLEAGADPSLVVMETQGKTGEFRFRKPVAWQLVDKEKRPVEAWFYRSRNQIRLRVTGHDASLPVVVDPVLDYATFLGGTGGASGESIAVDKDGFIYATGTVSSNLFPTSESAMQTVFAGSNDIYVAKFDPTGKELIFSTYFGSYGDDRAVDLAVDSEGRIYLTGFTTSPDFPLKNPIQNKFGGGSMAAGGDAIVVILDPSGSSVLFSTFFGGTLDDFGRSIALEKDGSIVVCGATISEDFPVHKPLQEFYGGGPRDGMMFKLAPIGAGLVYSTYMGGTGNDELWSVAIGPDSHAYFGGVTTSRDLIVVAPFQEAYGGGNRDIMLAKLPPDGSAWIFATYLGGTAEDYARAIAVDGEGFLYITGFSFSGNYPRRNPFDNTYGGSRDVIVTKMTPDAKEIVFSTFLGDTSVEEGYAIALAAEGEVVVAGHTQSLNFPAVQALQAGFGGTCRTQPCTADIFVTRFAKDGRQVTFSTFLGGTGADQTRGVHLTESGALWITGFTGSVNFPVVQALFDRHNGGGANIAYVAKVQF
jgi:hypothetical protein